MRINRALATAFCSSAFVFGCVGAEDAEDAGSSSTVAEESSTTSAIEKPTFTVSHHIPDPTNIPTSSILFLLISFAAV